MAHSLLDVFFSILLRCARVLRILVRRTGRDQIIGIDSDNGPEFINHSLLSWRVPAASPYTITPPVLCTHAVAAYADPDVWYFPVF
ncbi:MAG: hypothetical protein LBB48_07665 [Treponema sp.]|nr:hypothetical protein [Treponema sp.]